MNGVLVKAPAKLNLSLDITGKLENGYHTMDMLMQSVDLYEKVILTRAKGVSVRCIGSGGEPIDFIPNDRHNIAFKAAMMFFEATPAVGGVEIAITKTVPVGAGMGGGSSDAAATLVGLNKLYGDIVSTEKLCKIAASIGADVPFAILGGTARVTGFGEKVQKLCNLPNCWFVVCMPSTSTSTEQAFAAFDAQGCENHPETDTLQKLLEQGDLTGFCHLQKNVMQKSCGTIDTAIICEALRGEGALSALMTGSGAAIYGVFDNEEKAKAALLATKGMVATNYLLKPVSHGAIVENIF